jgi:hypothetical protein
MNAKTKIALLFLLFSLVPASLPAQPDYYTFASFPQMVFGGGYATYLTVSDPLSNGTREVYVSFYDQDGNDLVATVDQGIGQVSGFQFTLNALAEKTFAITGTGSATSGRLEIAAEGVKRFNSSLRYVTTDSFGNRTDVVGILPVSPTNSWTITVDKRQTWENVGVAIANWWKGTNPGDADAEVQFSLYQNGTQVGSSKSITVRELGQRSLYVDDKDLFPTFSGVGTLRISSPNVSVSVMAIRQDGAQFSSLPADAGTQLWNWTYTADSTTYTGSWSWRFQEEGDFYGEEQNPWNTGLIRVRGIYDTFFILEWWWWNSDTDQGTILFQGSPAMEGNTQVINGKRSVIGSDGSTLSSYTFKATRLY